MQTEIQGRHTPERLKDAETVKMGKEPGGCGREGGGVRERPREEESGRVDPGSGLDCVASKNVSPSLGPILFSFLLGGRPIFSSLQWGRATVSKISKL